MVIHAGICDRRIYPGIDTLLLLIECQITRRPREAKVIVITSTRSLLDLLISRYMTLVPKEELTRACEITADGRGGFHRLVGAVGFTREQSGPTHLR